MGLLTNFLNQCRKPQGFLGKIMLSGMSIGHASVADWAMSLLDMSDATEIVDIGCGNGRDIRELSQYRPERLHLLASGLHAARLQDLSAAFPRISVGYRQSL
ncbi:MAG: hypothetical protein IKI11_11735, partial [Neisseriaceae bacterium]|nr:hypothetical protein [Neisseriaceae bacterium]